MWGEDRKTGKEEEGAAIKTVSVLQISDNNKYSISVGNTRRGREVAVAGPNFIISLSRSTEPQPGRDSVI